jgi:hypothetical protein
MRWMVTVVLALVLGAAGYAQETVTLTGCLEASASLPGFRLLVGDEKQVYEVTAADGIDLSRHAGKTVEAIGSVTRPSQDAPPKMTINSVKTVAETCR